MESATGLWLHLSTFPQLNLKNQAAILFAYLSKCLYTMLFLVSSVQTILLCPCPFCCLLYIITSVSLCLYSSYDLLTGTWQRNALTGLTILLRMFCQWKLAYRTTKGGVISMYKQIACVVSCWHVYDTNPETHARGKWNMFWTTRGISSGIAHTV